MVMQYNILHDKEGWWHPPFENLGMKVRSGYVETVIRNTLPDILVLAERHDEWAGVPVTYCDASVTLSEMLKDIYTFAEDRIENGATVNRTPIAFRKDTFRCLKSGSVELGEEMPFAQSENKRVVSYAILEDISKTNSNGIRVVVFSTHWSSGQEQALVDQQSQSMQDVIRSVLSEADYGLLPVIVAGDFNTDYNNQAYQALLSGCGLADADMTANGLTYATIVDHIALKNCDVVSMVQKTQAPTPQASDHAPIVCEIKIGGK